MGPKSAGKPVTPAVRGKSSSPTRDARPSTGTSSSTSNTKTSSKSTTNGGKKDSASTTSGANKGSPAKTGAGAKTTTSSKGGNKADAKSSGAKGTSGNAGAGAGTKGVVGAKGVKGGTSTKSKDGATTTTTSTAADDKEREREGEGENKIEEKPTEEVAATSTSAPVAAGGKAEKPLNASEGPSVITGKIFMQAVVDSDIRALKTYILLRGPLPDDVVNYTNNSLMTPLMMAAQKKTDKESCDIIKVLLMILSPPKQIIKKGGDPNTLPAFEEGKCNPLSGHPSSTLVGKLDINMQNRDGYTALHFAARKNFAESILLLLDAEADYEIISTGAEKVTAGELTNDKKCKDYLINAVAMKAERARIQAVAVQGLACYTSVLKGDLRGVVRVHEKGAPPETYSFRPLKTDHYMLRHAIDLGHIEIFKQLLLREAEKDVWDSRGRTPLMTICDQARAGSYPTTKFSREKEAIRREFLEQLLDEGPCTNTMLERRDSDGNTALHIACEKGYIEDIISLIDKGAEVDARQISEYTYRGPPGQRIKSGDSAFIMVARRRQGYFECTSIGTSLVGNYMDILATLLYEGKANVNLRGFNGMTSLMWAAHNEDLELLEWLIDQGADINDQENFGQTALMQCMENSKIASATFLLQFNIEEHEIRKAKEAEEMAEQMQKDEEEREARK